MPAHILPEGYSYPLNLQQVVELGVAQVVAQGFQRSLKDRNCAYAGVDDMACHIGTCLPLNVARKWDHTPAYSLGGYLDESEEFFQPDHCTLSQFQKLHDGYLDPERFEGDPREVYTEAVYKFCLHHHLAFPEVLSPYRKA